MAHHFARALLHTGWVRRAENRIDAFDAPDVVGEDLVEVPQ